MYDPLFLKHDPGYGHPETPQRLQSIQSYLENRGFFDRAELIQPEPVTREDLKLIHSEEYIDFVLKQAGRENVVLDYGDTRLSEESVEAALLAAGSALKAIDLIYDDNFDKVFAAVRPPGHHAVKNSAMGFCVFNNIALCAAYAIKSEKATRVLIVDWDVHHGNGTQDMFYTSDQVFYLSLHQYPFYPMTGKAEESGVNSGAGYTMNCPLSHGTNDDEYVRILDEALEEIERHFIPDLVLISAGFDAHAADPIGGMLVSEQGFYKLTEIVARFAQRHSNGRIISFLEGGYNLRELPHSVYKHLLCMLKH